MQSNYDILLFDIRHPPTLQHQSIDRCVQHLLSERRSNKYIHLSCQDSFGKAATYKDIDDLSELVV